MKTAEEIYGLMKAAFEEKTGRDISDDCDMAVRLYAAAAQTEALYIYNDWVKEQCFPQTATGEYLARHARMRGLERNEALYAEGTIRFFVEEARETELTVPAGTVCLTGTEIYFVTTASAVIGVGDTYADAPARASLPGASGNVAAGAICFMSPAPAGVVSCGNTGAFTGGADEESDESLRERVLASYSKLPNGANKAYYESEVLAVPGTAAVCVLPKNRGVGTVDVVFTGVSGVPDEELITAVTERLETSREICVDIDVAAPETVTVNVTCKVLPAAGYDAAGVRANVKAALQEYFDGGLLGTDVTLARLGSVIFSVEGVENYKITAPAADISADADQLPVCGTVTVSDWS